MNTRFRITTGTALLLAFAVGAPAAAVADDDDRAEMEALVKSENFIGADDARQKALAAKPGTVIDIDLDRGWRGDYHYEVEVLDAELREWEIQIDAKTGKVLSTQRDWFD